MNILTVMGSPKKDGNTAAVLEMFESSVSGEHEVDRVDIFDFSVGDCLGCYACKEDQSSPGCVREDDMHELYDRLIRADVVVYATPLYCWGFTSPLKAFLDRHIALVKGSFGEEMRSMLEGKNAMLLVTSAGPEEQNADAIKIVFGRACGFLKMEPLGTFVLPFCTTPDAMGEDAREVAESMRQKLS